VRPLVHRDDGLVELAGAGDDAEPAPPRLLGPFDPLLLGWCSREPIVASTTTSSPRTASSARSRWSRDAPSRAGRCPRAASSSIRSPARARGRAALEAEAADVERFLAQ
jgi:hypothetical protein